MNDPIIGLRLFIDGVLRPVFGDGQSQYILDAGDRIDGFSVDPDQGFDQPVIVDVSDGHCL